MKLFFELLQVALSNRPTLSSPPSEREWELLYALAERHAVVGVTLQGVQRLMSQQQATNLPINLKIVWLGMASVIQERNKLMNERCVELQNTLTKDGFRTYIMKGQGNSALYSPELSLLRQSGDIDIFLEGGNKKVISYVDRTFPSKEVSTKDIQYDCFKDVVVEIHYKPLIMLNPYHNRRLQMFLEKEGDRCYENYVSLGKAGNISVPTIEFNLVHQMVHIFHHLFTEGVGLRQLMDYHFLVLNVKKHTPTTDYKSIIQTLDLERFASALMWTLGEVFGLKRSEMLWAPNEKDGRFLLNEIMQMGNFGLADKKQNGIYSNRWKSFWYVHFKTFRYWRFDHMAWFWSPTMRIKGFLWRKRNGYK